jgi:hypothetical protein
MAEEDNVKLCLRSRVIVSTRPRLREDAGEKVRLLLPLPNGGYTDALLE